MLTRVALFAASLAAAAVLAVGLALFGLEPALPWAGAPVDPVAATDPAPAPVTRIETVYVVPATPTAPSDPTPSPIVIQRVVGGSGGEHEDGYGDD